MRLRRKGNETTKKGTCGDRGWRKGGWTKGCGGKREEGMGAVQECNQWQAMHALQRMHVMEAVDGQLGKGCFCSKCFVHTSLSHKALTRVRALTHTRVASLYPHHAETSEHTGKTTVPEKPANHACCRHAASFPGSKQCPAVGPSGGTQLCDSPAGPTPCRAVAWAALHPRRRNGH